MCSEKMLIFTEPPSSPQKRMIMLTFMDGPLVSFGKRDSSCQKYKYVNNIAIQYNFKI